MPTNGRHPQVFIFSGGCGPLVRTALPCRPTVGTHRSSFLLVGADRWSALPFVPTNGRHLPIFISSGGCGPLVRTALPCRPTVGTHRSSFLLVGADRWSALPFVPTNGRHPPAFIFSGGCGPLVRTAPAMPTNGRHPPVFISSGGCGPLVRTALPCRPTVGTHRSSFLLVGADRWSALPFVPTNGRHPPVFIFSGGRGPLVRTALRADQRSAPTGLHFFWWVRTVGPHCPSCRPTVGTHRSGSCRPASTCPTRRRWQAGRHG